MLQTIPSISITSGRPLLLMPLSFVLTIAAVRDFFEDWQRKAADRVENERTVMRLDADGRLQPARWRTVRPGDVLRLMDGDPVPADAVLLDSSDPAKTCRVETSSLDGESDLKEKALDVEWRGERRKGGRFSYRRCSSSVAACSRTSECRLCFWGRNLSARFGDPTRPTPSPFPHSPPERRRPCRRASP